MIKRSGFITRRPDLTVEKFRKHWLEVHAPMVKEQAKPRRYVVNLVDRERYPDFPFDGFSELWFDKEEDWNVLFVPDSPMYLDLAKFMLPPNGVSMEEHIIVDGPTR